MKIVIVESISNVSLLVTLQMENDTGLIKDTLLFKKKQDEWLISSALNKQLFKLLKEHHDLSCDIKWLSIAHDFGKNIYFWYRLEPRYIYGFGLYIVFEDTSHLVDLDNPSKPVKERVYYFPIHKNQANQYYLTAFRWMSSGVHVRNYSDDTVYYHSIKKYGSLNDIAIADIKLGSLPVVLDYWRELFAIESIEKKRNELRSIRKEIDGIMVPLLLEYFPRVLTTIIVDYTL